MNLKPYIFAAALSTLAPWAAAQASTSAVAVAYADGEIKKIDPEQGKVTLKHGTIDSLGMPGMTMVFRVDAALVSNFKPGDSVRFKADRVDGALKVTELVAR